MYEPENCASIFVKGVLVTGCGIFFFKFRSNIRICGEGNKQNKIQILKNDK